MYSQLIHKLFSHNENNITTKSMCFQTNDAYYLKNVFILNAWANIKFGLLIQNQRRISRRMMSMDI